MNRLLRMLGRHSELLYLDLFGNAARSAAAPPTSYLEAGARTLSLVKTIVGFGPRPVGSDAHRRLEEFIVGELLECGCRTRGHSFIAETPVGPIEMRNIVAELGSGSEDNGVVVVSGHYDTLRSPGFLGANDGGSSTAFLLQLARMLQDQPLASQVWLVFFDGEEPLVKWQGSDHTYGSRHQAEFWMRNGVAKKIRAVINVDMIGQARLRIVRDMNSTPELRDAIWNTAHRLGYRREFLNWNLGRMADDHIEFIQRGYSAVNLIDFDYGVLNRHWHTTRDTIDRLGERSFAVVLHVVIETLKYFLRTGEKTRSLS